MLCGQLASKIVAMEHLAKVVCLLLCLKAVHLQMCPPPGPNMPACQQPDNIPDDAWVSRIRSDVSSTGQTVIRWNQDNSRAQTEAPYAVGVRVFDSREPFEKGEPTDLFDGYMIDDLTAGVTYEAVVCYRNARPRANFTRECGFCRTCFVASAGPRSRPNILEATVEENRRDLVYRCEASGNPLPSITWLATDDRNGRTITLSDDLNGVQSIESARRDSDGVRTSELVVSIDAPYEMVNCQARNGVGSVQRDQFTERERRPSPTTPSPPLLPTQPLRCPPPRRRQRQSGQRPPPSGQCLPRRPPSSLRRPVIGGATRRESEDRRMIIYSCQARAEPLPIITWTVMDRENDKLTLNNSFSGIRISDLTVEGSTVTSELSVAKRLSFSVPTCNAMNIHGKTSLTGNQFNELDGTGEEESEEESKSQGNTFPSYIIGIIVSGFVATMITTIIVITLCCYMSHRRKIKRLKRDTIEAFSLDAHEHKTVENGPTDKETSFGRQVSKRKLSLLSKLPEDMLLSPEVLEVSTVIGQGEFGVVYKGYLKKEMIDTVAIKTLKGIFATASDIENATAEILKMRHFDHPNVMKLIGVCVVPSDKSMNAPGPCMVMPFMARGSLLDNLRKDSDNLTVASVDDPRSLDVRKNLLNMCLQVARGMEYLADLRFIHRDLAARNCLVDADGVIKVSDFGLAEDIYSQNYFRQVQGGVKLPLKWMALESIKLGVFTTKTDVVRESVIELNGPMDQWSYGVTCWEIFSGGAIPYPGIHPRDVLNYLEEGERLARPKNVCCCDNMYALMLSMWDRRDEDRPTFSDLVSTLSSYLEVTSDYLDLGGLGKSPCKPKQGDLLPEEEALNIRRIPSHPNDYVFPNGQA